MGLCEAGEFSYCTQEEKTNSWELLMKLVIWSSPMFLSAASLLLPATHPLTITMAFVTALLPFPATLYM
jgi:hypothetical protein